MTHVTDLLANHPDIVDYSVKSMLVALIASMVALAWYRTSIAHARVLCQLAFAALLVLSIAFQIGPTIPIAMLPAGINSNTALAMADSARADTTLGSDVQSAQTMPVTEQRDSVAMAPSSISVPLTQEPAAVNRKSGGLRRVPAAPPVLVAWTIGIVITGLFWLISSIIMAARVRSMCQPPEPLAQLFTRLTKQVGMRRPAQLRIAHDHCMPYAIGIMRPVIVLPKSGLDWPVEQQTAVLMHELAHIKLGDLPGIAVARWITALHWWNPFVWLLRSVQRVTRERYCDQYVVQLGMDPFQYAESLVATVRQCRNRHFAPVSFARSSDLRKRIAAIVGGTQPQLPQWSGRATLFLVAMLVAVISPFACVRAVPKPPTSATTEQKAMNGDETEALVRITGRVIASDTNQPMTDIHVVAAPIESAPEDLRAHRRGKTNADGEFALQVKPGRHRVFVCGPIPGYFAPLPNGGMEENHVSPRPVFVPRPAGFEHEIDAGLSQDVPLLTIPVDRGLVIAGVVRDEQGEPVPNASIEARRMLAWEPDRMSTKTDAEGRFELQGLFPGQTYQLVARHVDRGLAGAMFIEAPPYDSAVLGALRQDVRQDLEVRNVAHIVGKVSLDGDALSDVMLRFERLTTWPRNSLFSLGTNEGYSTTDEQGNYRFEMVIPGETYTVSVEPRDHGDSYSNSNFVATPGQSYEHPEIRLVTYRRRLSGVVVDTLGSPIVGAEVRIDDHWGTAPHFAGERTHSDATGSFYFEKLPEGPLSLSATPYWPDRGLVAYIPVDAATTQVRVVLDPQLRRTEVRDVK